MIGPLEEGWERYYSILNRGLTCGVFRSTDEAMAWAQNTGRYHPLTQGFFSVVSYIAPADGMYWSVPQA